MEHLHILSAWPSFDGLQHALLHSLWQGLLLAGLVGVALWVIPAGRAALRYGVCVVGLGGVVAALVVTWCVLGYDGAEPSTEAPAVETTQVANEAAPLAPTETPDATRSVKRQSTTPIHRWLLPAWLTGVCVMLVRALGLLGGAERIRRACHAADDPALLASVEELKRSLRITRRVTVLIGERLVSPAVVGLVFPTLLLPASMVTGLTPTQLRAVLAHELAHIRRYDYLVNFLQLVVESLLYFNPAVWWLSRQIRIEREACCDAAAASVTGTHDGYVEALADAARLLRDGPTPAVALGDARDTSGLLERARRLLVPGYRPRLRLRWYSFVLGLLTTGIALFGLYQGSLFTVAFAEWMLTPEERIETIAAINATHAPPKLTYEERRAPENKARVSGTIRTKSGAPLSVVPPGDGRGIRIMGSLQWARGVSSVVLRSDGESFDAALNPGTLTIMPSLPGYAPAAFGPFELEPGGTYDNLEIVLEKALPAYIGFSSPSGEPVEGVQLTGLYQHLDMGCFWTIDATSDAKGRVRIDQASEPVPVRLAIRAKGFQRETRKDVLIPPNEAYTWTLKPAPPIEGIVLDGINGTPIEGAELLLAYNDFELRSEEYAIVEATTDASGHFVLDEINPNESYHYLLRAAGCGRELLHDVQHWEAPRTIAMRPRFIEGTVRGDLDLLPKNTSGKPYVEFHFELSIEQHSTQLDYPCEVELTDDGGRFRLDDVLPGLWTVQAGDALVNVRVQESVTELAVELGRTTPPSTREVVFCLVPPEGSPPARGTLAVRIMETDRRGRPVFPRPRELPVSENRASTTSATPGRAIIEPQGLMGYSPDTSAIASSDERGGMEIPEGTEPFKVRVPLLPAGAIYGEGYNANGTPISDAYLSIRHVPQSSKDGTDKMNLIPLTEATSIENGKFAFPALPLGHSYIVSLSSGPKSVCSEPILVDQRSPIHHLKLRFTEGMDITGTILDPSGRPAGGARYRLQTVNCGHTALHGWRQAEADGSLRVRGFMAEQNESLEIHVDAYQDCQPVHHVVENLYEPQIIRLRKGFSFTGVLVEQDTGHPIPGAKVCLSENAMFNGDQEYVITDQDGLFTVRNLAPKTYRVFVRNVGVRNGAQRVTLGQAEPVVVPVELLQDSELKPRAPAEPE